MKNTTGNEKYDLIGRLAIALYGQGITISFSSLKQIMIDNGFDYSSNRGMASSVKAAFYAWEEIDPVVHHAIAYNFVGKDGLFAWEHYEE